MPPDPSAMFAELDSDEDGTLTEEEFLAGKPEDVSDAEAKSLWASIAGEDADGVTEAQFTEGMAANAPERQSAGAQSASANAISDSLIQQLLAAIEAYESSNASGYASLLTASTTSIAA